MLVDGRVRFPRVSLRVRRCGSAHARADDTRFIADAINKDGRHCCFRARIVGRVTLIQRKHDSPVSRLGGRLEMWPHGLARDSDKRICIASRDVNRDVFLDTTGTRSNRRSEKRLKCYESGLHFDSFFF